MLKKLDIYIIRQLLFKLFYCILSFTIIFIVVDLIDHIDKFIDASMPKTAIFKYYLYTIPWYISIALPMSTLISTVLTISTMNKLNELSTLKSSGVSFFRISVPILTIGIILSIFSFHFDNKVVTNSFKKRVAIEQENEMWGKINKNKKKREIFRQIGPEEILYIKRFQHTGNIATNVTLQKFKSNNLIYRMDIKQMNWNRLNSNWETNHIEIKEWLNGKLHQSVKHEVDTAIIMNVSPQDLILDSTRPREMNYIELKEFVKKMESNAISSPMWKVDLHFKTAFAATSFLMVLFGLSLSMKNSRNSFATGLGLSIITIFLYYIALKMGQSLGYKAIIVPFFSVWAPNILFLSIGLYLFFKIRS